jgi:RHS repeat-associated protein
VATYGYDDASRLTSETITGDPRGATFSGAVSYILDDVANLLSRTSTLAVLGAQSVTYNANDEINGDTFDDNGNTTASGGHTYGYDFENHLVSKDSSVVTLQYDCEGDRVAKTVDGVTTRYLVDDLNPTGYLQVLEEVVGGAVQTRYAYGTRIVSQTRNVSSSPVTSYYGYDAHGNITFLTDGAGSVTDSYDYDAWGNVIASSGTTPNTRLYTGEEFDPDLGFTNLRVRQYRSGIGRFESLDPEMGIRRQPVTLNRYLYANGDPVNLLDPTGRMAAEYTLVQKFGEAVSKISATEFWSGTAILLGYIATAASEHSVQTILAADAVCAAAAAKTSASAGGERGFGVGIACILTVLAGAFAAPPS